MADTPADTLRAAAARIREHIGYLQLERIRGPFAVTSQPGAYPQTISNVGTPILIANTFTDPKAPPVIAEWIALMHPGVGELIADWLESAARTWEFVTYSNRNAALAVAHAVLDSPDS
jgi:hypothetical protein